jgi:hypothetical protein
MTGAVTAARCATLACTRKVRPGWLVCNECADKILYGPRLGR